MDQLLRKYNLPNEIGFRINNLLVYLHSFDKVVKEINSSQMLAQCTMSANGEEPHTYEWCHTPSTAFALHKSFYKCTCQRAWPYCMKGKFMYPRKMQPVYLANWKQYNLTEDFKIKFDKVIRELNLSEIMHLPSMSANGEEPHTYEWCHIPSTLFAVHSPSSLLYRVEGKFIYPKKQNPVYLANWSKN